ncbi:MAG: ZIP family metal transporter [Bacteroidota bacterium]|nr:ZIP family metal transporter [Bacteroidota bacterium]
MFTIILFGLFAAAAEILGGCLVILKKDWPKKVQEYLIALGAGFILALVFLELIPESIEHLGHSAPLFMLLGFALIHFFEHTIVGHLHFGEETHTDIMLSKTASYSALSGLLIHAFFDGLAISAAFHFDFYIGLMLFIAVLLHKLPEGLTVATIMLASNQTRKNAFWATVAIGMATMAGIIAVFFLAEIDPTIIGIVFAISAGIATYVGASDLIPEINRSENRITPIIVFAGMLLFYLSKLMIEQIAGH